MPTPNKGEKKKDFISRCMSSSEAQKDFPDQSQRYAFCQSQWSNKKKHVKVSDILNKRLIMPKTTIADILRKGQEGPEKIVANYQISTISSDQRLVTGQVYAPNSLDAHGHFMTAPDLQDVAHSFLADGLLTSIDVMHNNEPIDAVIVESFIARKGDPDFEEGAWVATTKINDTFAWKLVKDGVLNGYSFEILTYKKAMIVEIEYASWYYGFTDPDPYDNHSHPFMVRMDDNGEIIWGKTGLGTDGSPAHTISKSSVTDPIAGGKTHRYHLKAA